MSIDLFRGKWKQDEQLPENFDEFINVTDEPTSRQETQPRAAVLNSLIHQKLTTEGGAEETVATVTALPQHGRSSYAGTGVYKEKRDQVSKLRLIVDFDANGDKWIYKISVEGMPEPQVYTYKFDEAYSATDLMGTTFKCVVSKLADNKIQESITEWSDMDVVTTRTVNDDGTMTVVATCKGVSTTSQYNKL